MQDELTTKDLVEMAKQMTLPPDALARLSMLLNMEHPTTSETRIKPTTQPAEAKTNK